MDPVPFMVLDARRLQPSTVHTSFDLHALSIVYHCICIRLVPPLAKSWHA